jgi:Tol biopolymer transport system component
MIRPENRLDSWKEIASYLGRGVRTVQRWEREEGLPVHRLAHEKRGSVYADKHEVDAWWESRRQTLATQPEPEPSRAPVAERITWMSAATFWPTFSSDGRLVAYVSDGGRVGALPQIWLQQVGGSAACLTSGAADRSSLAFSHDDTRILFTVTDDHGQSVYSIPTLGGEPRLVKRDARGARPSPNGNELVYIATGDASGVRICAPDGTGDRLLGRELLDIAFAIWSPDSRSILVYGHPDPSLEPDYWVIPADGGAPVATGILGRMRERGVWPYTLPAAWIGNTLLFSGITQRGVILWRQGLSPETRLTTTDAAPLTQGHEMDSFVTPAGTRAGFVSVQPDQNLWSIALDPSTGQCHDTLRRLTRGPGVVSQLSLTHDTRTLVYFFGGPNGSGIRLTDLQTGVETELGLDRAFPAVSPSGRQVAFSVRSLGPQVVRPLAVAQLPNGESCTLADDATGRPRQWVDERIILIERFGSRLLSVALFDTETRAVVDILAHPDYSITNARVSPDRRWIAFDAARPGAAPSVFVAAFHHGLIPPDRWVRVDGPAGRPFWAADGRYLYYLPTSPSFEIRNVIRGRGFAALDGTVAAEAFTAFASREMVISTTMTGAAPVAASDQILLTLANFRGDVWAIDL